MIVGGNGLLPTIFPWELFCSTSSSPHPQPPYLVSTRHKLAAGRGTDGLHIVVLQLHPLACQSVQIGGPNLRPVVADVVKPIVVSKNEHYVWSVVAVSQRKPKCKYCTRESSWDRHISVLTAWNEITSHNLFRLSLSQTMTTKYTGDHPKLTHLLNKFRCYCFMSGKCSPSVT